MIFCAKQMYAFEKGQFNNKKEPFDFTKCSVPPDLQKCMSLCSDADQAGIQSQAFMLFYLNSTLTLLLLRTVKRRHVRPQ